MLAGGLEPQPLHELWCLLLAGAALRLSFLILTGDDRDALDLTFRHKWRICAKASRRSGSHHEPPRVRDDTQRGSRSMHVGHGTQQVLPEQHHILTPHQRECQGLGTPRPRRYPESQLGLC